MNVIRVARFVALAVVLALSPACASGPDVREGDWEEAEFTIASERVLRQAAQIALQKNGFAPGTATVEAHKTVSSGWKVELQPFKGDGMRRKAHVQYEEKGERTWLVSVRVEKESNEEIAKPLDLASAKWVSADDDTETAGRILRYIKTVFGPEPGTVAPPAAGTTKPAAETGG